MLRYYSEHLFSFQLPVCIPSAVDTTRMHSNWAPLCAMHLNSSSCHQDISHDMYTLNGFASTAIKALWPSDGIWRNRPGPMLVLALPCCLAAPSHYLNQCRPTNSGVLRHSPESNFTGNAQDIYIPDVRQVLINDSRCINLDPLSHLILQVSVLQIRVYR